MQDGKTRLWDLFTAFMRVGVLTFGGGMAMLPMLERECVSKTGWVTGDELLDCFAIAQCTPGIIAVNTATFVGYKRRGVTGGIVATLGVVLPSFLIITALASIIRVFSGNIWVAKAFAGIRVAVVALILNALLKLVKKSVKGIATAVIGVLSLCLQLFLGVSPIVIVASAIAIGVCVWLCSRKKEDEK